MTPRELTPAARQALGLLYGAIARETRRGKRLEPEDLRAAIATLWGEDVARELSDYGKRISGGGSAETSRSCGHTAGSGAAAANVATETANHSVRGAGGAV